MRQVIKRLAGLFLIPIFAVSSWADVAMTSYSDHPEVLAFIDELVVEDGFDRQQLIEVFAQAEYKQRIIDAISRPAERVLHWDEYQDIFLTKKRLSQGLEFIREHSLILENAEREFGVPAEIIAAILGVETSYGRNTGSYRVLDALSTLAFNYPRRAKFFKGELKHMLLLARAQGKAPELLMGSYAGAMGLGQFIPSSYRAYAIDFDDDGQIDIWNDPVDAIGSVANYLNRHGWAAGEGVLVRLAGPASLASDQFNVSLRPSMAVAEARLAGLLNDPTLEETGKVSPIKLNGKAGAEYFLGLKNFYVITRYNHSRLYAMAVFQLSQHLAQGASPDGQAD